MRCVPYAHPMRPWDGVHGGQRSVRLALVVVIQYTAAEVPGGPGHRKFSRWVCQLHVALYEYHMPLTTPISSLSDSQRCRGPSQYNIVSASYIPTTCGVDVRNLRGNYCVWTRHAYAIAIDMRFLVQESTYHRKAVSFPDLLRHIFDEP